MQKDYRLRSWIKQRVPEDQMGNNVLKIWSRWKKKRIATKSIAHAILLYDALLRGDGETFHRLMIEFFPGYGLSLGPGAAQPRYDTARPEPVRPTYQSVSGGNGGQKQKLAPPKIQIKAEAYGNELEDDDLGFGNLEIG